MFQNAHDSWEGFVSGDLTMWLSPTATLFSVPCLCFTLVATKQVSIRIMDLLLLKKFFELAWMDDVQLAGNPALVYWAHLLKGCVRTFIDSTVMLGIFSFPVKVSQTFQFFYTQVKKLSKLWRNVKYNMKNFKTETRSIKIWPLFPPFVSHGVSCASSSVMPELSIGPDLLSKRRI